MSRIPPLGVAQRDARRDGLPPRLRTRSLWAWRAWDGLLAPLNDGVSVAYRGRSSAATIYGSDGTSGTLAAAAPAFTCVDWDGDGIREAEALLLGPDEALRYYDATTGGLAWDMGAKCIRLDWLELGNAMVTDAPYWSYTTDAVAGAYLAILGTGTGGVRLEHYNGTTSVVSTRLVPAGARCSLRAQFFATGAVQCAIVINGGNESVASRSGVLAPAGSWGLGGTPRVRVNELGTTDRGTLALRYGAVFPGLWSRAALLETT